MRKIAFDPEKGRLLVGGTSSVPYDEIYQMFAGAFDELADVSLVSFRNTAKRYRARTKAARLELGWADHPPSVVVAVAPPLELVWLTSDGNTVAVVVQVSLFPSLDFPESESDVEALLVAAVEPLLARFGAAVKRVKVESYTPVGARKVEMTISFPPQRRTVGDAHLLGKTIRDLAGSRSRQFLDSPLGVVSLLEFAPAALIGQVESEWLDAKRQPYNLDLEAQKLELAKDAAAFANSEGGVIVFGFSTQGESGADRIARVRAFDTSRLDPQRYLQVIRARMFPMPEKLRVGRVGGGATGLGYLLVPRQPEELKPFVLRETTSKGRIRSTSLTIPVRIGAQVEYSSPESIHSLIVAGRAALRA